MERVAPWKSGPLGPRYRDSKIAALAAEVKGVAKTLAS
jgi:hypothetical protein